MRINRHLAICGLISVLLVLAGTPLATPAAAATRIQHDAVLQVAQRGGPSLGEAVAQVRRRYKGGRILSAETQVRGNREVHLIKVLTRDGKVKTERIAGRTRGGRG